MLFMGKFTILMVIFHSYVNDDELPNILESHKNPWFQSPPTSILSYIIHKPKLGLMLVYQAG